MQIVDTWKLNNKVHDTNNRLIQDINTITEHSSRNRTINPTYLLDFKKTKYSFIEKYVYDIAMFHFERLNIQNIKEHHVEFWFKGDKHTNSHELHVDCDECLKKEMLKYKYPILATVTYLNDFYNSPTIITNVDLDTYNNKNFENQTELTLSLPVANKHISFHGNFFHGSTKLSDIENYTSRYIIAINLWDTLPLTDHDYCQDFNTITNSYIKSIYNKKDNPVISIHNDDNFSDIIVDKSIINEKFFNDILHTQPIHNTICYRFNDIIKQHYNKSIHTFKFILNKQINTNSNDIPTFIINLQHNLNRKLSMTNKINYTNIKNYKFINAVDGKTDLDSYNFKIMPDWIDPILKRKMNSHEIGCFLSHYSIWKYIITHNIDVALILEDDCIFLDNFNNEFEQILHLNPTTYDYFSLGRNRMNDKYNMGPELSITDTYVIPKYSYNAHSYLLTKNGARILTNKLAIENIIPVDEYIPIMYNSFPVSTYSDYFKHMPKLKAIGLIDDITNQEPK